MRRAASLIELLVCLAIIGTLVSMMLPALSKVRATANTTACNNNMRQLALGMHGYHDAHKHLPYPRECPAPWQGGKDPYCTKVSSPVERTGPAERWWAPYDNRPGATVADALGDYRPAGLILPFVGNSTKVFRCPDGTDRTPGSPTQGRAFQVSYVLMPQATGKKLGEYTGAILAEHDDAPVCPNPAAHYAEWPAAPAVRAARHAPTGRHTGAFGIARHDGSVHVTR